MQASLTIEQRVQEGLAAQNRGDFAAAEALYLQILAIQSDHFDALHLLGVIRIHQGRNFEALELIGTALKKEPNNAWALSMGMVLSSFGRTQEALESYNNAIALMPDFPEALNNRGLIFFNQKDFAKALKNFDRALSVRPTQPDALFNRGNTLLEMRRFEEAIATYQKALATNPSSAPILNNLGNALCELNRFDEALAAYNKALALAPNYADAFNNRGRINFRLKRYGESLADFGNALAFAPTHVEALNNRGNTLRDMRRYAEAIGDFERALALAPGHPHAFGGLADAALKICDWPRMEKIGRELPAHIGKGDIVPPLTLLGYTSDPQLQLDCLRVNVAHLVPPGSTPPESNRVSPARRQNEKLRIAYLSSDYFSHATAFLMAELFEIHDRSRFDILGVCFSRDDQSDMRARLISAFDEFHLVQTRDDREVAELIRQRKVEIAVDLKGFTQDSRPGILATRPAPVQATYLGFPGPMGADFIDYVIADPIVLPFEQQPFYTEKIVQLPDCYQVNDSRRAIAASAPSRRDASLPEQGFVFCCFNNNWKITPPVFDVWMQLLRAVEGSVLWLIRDNEAAAANLRNEAAARGIDPNRLVFAEHVTLEQHLARHRLADLFLDTLLYNAHTIASDALWTGLPIVTCHGESFAGRVGASLLHAAGLSELVTTNLADYEALALRLANEPMALQALRKRLTANRSSFPLFDTDRFRRHIESAYTTMWDIYRSGKAPRGFRVEPIPGAAQSRPQARQPEQKKPEQKTLAPARTSSSSSAQAQQSTGAEAQKVKLLLVCGPWGSGTTAVAGLLQRLGIVGLEPYFETRDARTPNSYESILFRDVMLSLADEEGLSLRDGAPWRADAALGKFRDHLIAAVPAAVKAQRPIFLKHPLSALFLPQICTLFDARLIYVVRPIAEIGCAIRRQGR